jgi:nitrite reductase/ring-hydroxylating ferredoxin subunit
MSERTSLPTVETPAWRQDFPIDWPQQHFVARRDFTKFLMLTSLPFALVQVGIVVQNWLRCRRGQPPVLPIARLADVPVGSSIRFHYPGEHDPCVLVRPDEHTLRAYGGKCTHLGCAVVAQIEEGRLYCPCHKGSFALDSGRPLAGPPRRPLPRVILEIRASVIHATGLEVNPV